MKSLDFQGRWEESVKKNEKKPKANLDMFLLVESMVKQLGWSRIDCLVYLKKKKFFNWIVNWEFQWL